MNVYMTIEYLVSLYRIWKGKLLEKIKQQEEQEPIEFLGEEICFPAWRLERGKKDGNAVLSTLFTSGGKEFKILEHHDASAIMPVGVYQIKRVKDTIRIQCGKNHWVTITQGRFVAGSPLEARIGSSFGSHYSNRTLLGSGPSLDLLNKELINAPDPVIMVAEHNEEVNS